MPATKIERHAAPLRQQVVRLLREDILEGELPAGARIRENALCEKYEVSRTVVREALRQLESESLITVLPNRGPIVTVLTKHDIEALYQVRAALEGLAGELFARNATDEQAQSLRAAIAEMDVTYLHGTPESREASKEQFYELLLEGAGNEVLSSTLAGIHARIGRFRHYAFHDEHRVAISMQELRVIVHAAAVLRDAAAARQACEHHIQLSAELAIIEYVNRLQGHGSDELEAGTAS